MSAPSQNGGRTFRFGVFEVDLEARELRKRGVQVKLQDQPFRVLEALLEKPGEIVTRQELKERLWAQDEHVEFDKSLNTAVQKIRQALGDSASSPRFVETVPTVGYRFTAPVNRGGDPPPAPRPWFGRRAVQIGLVCAGLPALAGVLALLPKGGSSSEPAPRFVSRPLSYEPGSEVKPSFSPDGTRVAYHADGGQPDRADIYIQLVEQGAGEPFAVTSGPYRDIEPAWSPDGSRLVFVRILEDRPSHIGATFKLMLAAPVADAPLQELDSRTFQARNPGGIEPSWSADGRHIVFSCKLDESSIQVQICIYSLDAREAWALTEPSGSGVGDSRAVLSPDGRTLVYQAANRPGEVALFYQALTDEMRPRGDPWPVPGAAGSFKAAWSSDGRTLYYAGRNIRGEAGLWVVETAEEAEARLLWPAGAPDAALYQDDRGVLRVAYSDLVEEAELVRVDLRNPEVETVLAPSRLADYHPQFSPDGSKIAFFSKRSGVPGVWICNSDGTGVHALTEVGPYGYFAGPMWSPDGTRIATDGFFGARNTHIVDVATKQVGPALTNRGGRMPTWSKDGKSLWYYSHVGGVAALWKLDVETGKSKKLRDAPGILDIDEAPDGKSLYYSQGYDLMRAELSDGRIVGEPRAVASQVQAFALTEGAFYVRDLSGAILRTDIATGQTKPVLQTGGRQDVPNLGFTVSPDERWLVYTRNLRREYDLRLLERAE